MQTKQDMLPCMLVMPESMHPDKFTLVFASYHKTISPVSICQTGRLRLLITESSIPELEPAMYTSSACGLCRVGVAEISRRPSMPGPDLTTCLSSCLVCAPTQHAKPSLHVVAIFSSGNALANICSLYNPLSPGQHRMVYCHIGLGGLVQCMQMRG